MKKILSDKLTLFFKSNFPYISKRGKTKRYMAYIGVGGNIGNTIRRFDKLFLQLQKDSRLELLNSAPILKNPPFGYERQGFFYNTVIKIATNLSPKELLTALLKIEKRYKRERSFKNAPRTLDLDIIFFQNRTLFSDDLIIPHPKWSKRESVVIPLYWMQKHE
jgi:2-amino-4-hydroxy-6-hydroxymethyldihydropteridine diphosphokinase